MFYIQDFSLLCNLGDRRDAVAEVLLRADRPLPERQHLFERRFDALCGALATELPALPEALARYDCRNNRLAAAALASLAPVVDSACLRFGRQRVGVVMATSTSGIDSTQAAIADTTANGFHPVQGMLGGLGEFSAALLGTSGPVFTISTACSSGGNALLAARRLLRLGLCDAVVCGGVDTLCELTVRGFAALEAVASELARPLEATRDGINVGEAAACFVLTREPGKIRFSGGAASSDAHHISAPHPEGDGAFTAMSAALADAGLDRDTIDYLSLHGTGTPHNDSMEAKAVTRLFGEGGIACSSSKGWTGHTLGAAAAVELALCCQLLLEEYPRLPPMQEHFTIDPALAALAVAGPNHRPRRQLRHCMSNAFAFGGNNVSLIVSHPDA